jgi:hypothetical protein
MGRHEKTLAAIRATPTRANLRWGDIESLLDHVGAEKEEGAGSRVRFFFREQTLVIHRPHPRPETKKAVVEAIRDFLSGVEL